jgi:hypothetical protein
MAWFCSPCFCIITPLCYCRWKRPRSTVLHWRSCAGILEQSMGARNRVGIELSYRPARLHGLADSIPGLLNSLQYRFSSLLETGSVRRAADIELVVPGQLAAAGAGVGGGPPTTVCLWETQMASRWTEPRRQPLFCRSSSGTTHSRLTNTDSGLPTSCFTDWQGDVLESVLWAPLPSR